MPVVQGLRGVSEVIAFSTQHSANLNTTSCSPKTWGGLSGEQYETFDQSTIEVKRMLAGLIKKVEADRRAN